MPSVSIHIYISPLTLSCCISLNPALRTQTFITELGFSRFRYSTIPTGLGSNDPREMMNFDLRQRADGRVRDTIRQDVKNLQTIADQDNLWKVLIDARKPVIHPSPAICSAKVQAFFNRYDINSQIFLPMRWQTGNDWFSLFSFQSRMSPDDLEHHYKQIHGTLNARDLGWHLELMPFRQRSPPLNVRGGFLESIWHNYKKPL